MTSNRVPHSPDAERAVLGALMLSDSAVAESIDIVGPDDFYSPSHRVIFQHAVGLYSSGKSCDVVTLAHSLDASGDLEKVGGSRKLIELQATTPVINNVGQYAKIVRDSSVLRKLIGVASQIREIGFEGSVSAEDAVSEAERLLFDISGLRSTDSAILARDAAGSVLDEISEGWSRPDGVIGLPTGFRSVDLMLSGLMPTRVVILGARPSMGKSAFAANVAANVAVSSGLPVTYYSLEMSTNEIIQRLVCSMSMVSMNSLSKGILTNNDWIRINRSLVSLASSNLIIDPDPSVSALEIHSRARKLRGKHGKIGLVVIDYLQLMTSGGKQENRQQEVSSISRQIKLMAKDLDAPVLALSQLTRGLEARDNKRPMLSDLRESGSIEQDADVVAFLYRDEQYNPDSEWKGFAEFIIAKQRQGPTGSVKLGYVGPFTKFVEIATSMR